jgi:hypothetical protein
LIKYHYDKNNQYIETYYEKKFVEMGYKINFLIARLKE